MPTIFDGINNFLFEQNAFLPHGVCLDWRPDLVVLHAASDAGIFLAYSTIPAALLYFTRERRDLVYKPIFYLFAIFILACGATHAFGLLTLWEPVYGLQGVFKAATALISMATAVAIWPILPKAIALPSPTQLREANEELLREVAQRREVEAELQRQQLQFKESVREWAQALELSEARFRDFASVSADWFWEQDQDLRFTFISKATEKGEHWKPNAFIGKTRRETLDEAFLDETLTVHERTLENRKAFDDFRVSRTTDDGSVVHISLRGKPFHDKNGAFAGYRGTGTDITNLVNTENALRAERDRAETANNAKSNFVANMSHELRTPLNGIIGYSEFLTMEFGRKISDEKRDEILLDIRKTSTHLLALIDDILDLSRIESGKVEVHPSVVAVETALNDCAEILGAKAMKKDVALNISPIEPSMAVFADQTHVNQILVNIVGNAVKYNRKGGHVAISAEENRDGRDGLVTIVIEDTGIGIDEADLPKVFEKFERAGNVLSQSEGGTGLGLPLAKQLVELNHGSIAIESTVDVGTIVTINLPCTNSTV
jgi:PAS domain S-box-containing protein